MKVMTGREYREKNRERVEKLREKMLAKGYKQLTLFFNEEFRAELKNLSENERLKKHEILDLIFEGYKNNKKLLNKNSLGTAQDPGEPPNKSAITPPHEYPNTQNELFDDSDVGNAPKLSRAELDKILLEVATEVGRSNEKRAARLNELGVLTTKGEQWDVEKVRIDLKNAKKRSKIPK